MANVIPFPKVKTFAATDKPAGMIDVFESQHGMFLLDGCIPSDVLPAILALMGTAGVRVRNNAA